LHILNIFLRGITLISKLFLIVFLAKLLPPEQIGVYGLVIATISYALYLVGFDFYTFSTREIVSCDEDQWPSMIRDQAVFSLIMYIVIFPSLLAVFIFDVLEWGIVGWFYTLLVLEHISQELNRLLIAMGRPITASVVLFVRMGAWCFVAIALMLQFPMTRSLTTIWSAWLLGTLVSVFLAVFSLRHLNWKQTSQDPVNWAWLKNGARTAFIFFLGTIALRGIFTLDRYIMKYYVGLEILGVYVFFVLIGNGLYSLIDAGVIVFVYPKMVGAYRKGNFEEYRKNIKELILGILITIMMLLIGLWLFINPLLDFVGKVEYSRNINSFWLIMFAICIWCVSMIPHYILYSKGKDKIIIISTWITFAVFTFLSLILVPSYGLQGIAYSLIVSFTINLVLKYKYIN